MPVQPDHYALVMGIDDYPSGDLKPLANAKRDAQEFQKWLLDADTGGGLSLGHCRLVLSSAESVAPLLEQIDLELETIINLAKGRPSDARRLYLYFSGHGMAASFLRAFLCLPRWSNVWRRAALDSEDYCLMLVDTGLFSEVVCFFDCCRSYKPSVGGHGSQLGGVRPDQSAANSKLFLAFAAAYLQQAFEESAADGHGFFTRALLSGLRGGACQPQGGAPAHLLKAFLENETVRLAKAAGKIQEPQVFNGFPANHEPVFGSALPLSQQPRRLVYLVSVNVPLEQGVVLVYPNMQELAWDGSQPWRIEAAEGLHVLQNKTSGRAQLLPRDATQGEINVEFGA